MTALSIKNLRKTYRNGVEAVKGIDLDVKRGDFFALLGPNGAGKSTVIGIISSLINKTAGSIAVFDHDLETEKAAAKRSIGLVPQEFNFNLFLPAVEVVVNQAGYYGIPRREAYRRAERCLRQLDLWEQRKTMARELSGGMKRRLMIARALVHEPRLLILDEPTAGVDIEIRRAMWRFMRDINRNGTTIILTTHYLEEAESLCRNIAIIDHGRLIEDTTMAELLGRLKKETFVLNLRGCIADLPELGGYVLEHIDQCTLQVEVPGDQSINGLFEALSRNGIEVISMRNKQNRLEQLFIDMVERKEPGETGIG